MFVTGAQQNPVVALVCGPCPLRRRCLALTLAERPEFGVWGGLTERRRRALFKQFPPGCDPAEVLHEAEQLVQQDTDATAVKNALRFRRRMAATTTEQAA